MCSDNGWRTFKVPTGSELNNGSSTQITMAFAALHH